MDGTMYLEIVGYALGDVFQPFLHTVTMTVYFGGDMVINSSELKKYVVQNAPRVFIGGQHDELYTLVMFDADAPNPNDPSFRNLVSWIVTNIPGKASNAQGTEIASYVGPNPEIGIHRIILFLYKQQSRLNDVDALTTRICFDIDGFANKHNLGNPVGMTYFNVRRQANGRNARA